MRKHTLYIIALLFLSPFFVLAQKKSSSDLTVKEYVEKFQDIAIQEMERSGIPASITLAQGIHESAYGNSPLAKKSNNHFGIKCTKDWDGDKTYKWDDEANKSCFRVYKNAEHSYVDHTDFLLKRKHYAFLFEYERTEYEKWAKGLRKAGYATDPKYPEKLIATIKKYELQQYDKVTGVLAYDPEMPDEIKNLPIYASTGALRTKPRSFLFKSYKPGFFRENGATYAISRKGESALAVAKRFGIPYKRFLKFNDLKDGDELIDYQPAYIQPKKSTYRGDQSFYKVEQDITMYEIAQHFGIKYESLLAYNLLKEGEEPQNGEMIMLKEKAISKPKLRAENHKDKLPAMYLEEEDVKKNSKPVARPAKVTQPKVPIIERPKPEPLNVNTPTYTKDVYADTGTINTSKSKDKDFLNMVVGPEDNVSSSSNDNTTNTSSSINGGSLFGTNYNNNSRPNTSTNDNGRQNDTKRPSSNENSLFGSSNNNNNNRPIDQPDRSNTNNHPPINNNSLFGGTKSTNNTNGGSLYGRPDKQEPPKTDLQNGTVSNNSLMGSTKGGTFIDNNETIHVVQKGQTLWAIYQIYKVKVDRIKAANQLVSDNINPGQRLIIPTK